MDLWWPISPLHLLRMTLNTLSQVASMASQHRQEVAMDPLGMVAAFRCAGFLRDRPPNQSRPIVCLFLDKMHFKFRHLTSNVKLGIGNERDMTEITGVACEMPRLCWMNAPKWRRVGTLRLYGRTKTSLLVLSLKFFVNKHQFILLMLMSVIVSEKVFWRLQFWLFK